MNKKVLRVMRVLLTLGIVMVVLTGNIVNPKAYFLFAAGNDLDTYSDSRGTDIRANKLDVCFGTYTEGTYVQNQEIVITNYGTDGAWLTWRLTDPGRAFCVDAPNDLYLPAGSECSFYVYPKSNMSAGAYTGSLLIADEYEYSRAASISLSQIIITPQPHITGVSISPTNTGATRGGSVRFNANVYGENDYSKSVNWTISGQTSGNTNINSDGLLTIGNDENAASILVRAESNADRNYSATANVNITRDSYTISTSSSPSAGGTTYGGGTVSQGDSVTITASPATGYKFVNWTNNGRVVSDSARYQLGNIGENMSLVANFQKTTCYIKTTSNIEQAGTITSSFNVDYNSSARVTATAKDGYRFEGWYEGNNKLSSDSTFTLNNVTDDRTLNAVFVKNSYEIKVTINGNTGGSVVGAGSYNAGNNATLIATPSSGYTFVSWMLGGREYSKDRNITIYNVSQDYNLTAYFVKDDVIKYDIVSSVNGSNGYISPAGTYQVPKGTSVVYTITPNSGYSVSDVYIDGVSVGAVINYTFNNVVSNHTISASFVKNPVATPTPVPTQAPAQLPVDDPVATPVPVSSPEPMQTAAPIQDSLDDPYQYGSVNGADVDVQVVPVDTALMNETGVLQEYNLRDEDALEIIRSGNGQELFEAAIENGTYQVSIYNELNPEANGVAVSALIDGSVPNFAQVLNGLLNENQKMKILHGEPMAISLNIFNNSAFISDADRLQFSDYEKKAGVTVDEYFEIIFMVTDSGYTSTVENLTVPMTIVVDVPEELRGSSDNFCILRLHTDNNGITSVTPLNDEDNNPSTITFTTDRFSFYAIAHHSSGWGSSKDNKDSNLASVLEFCLAGAGVLLILSIIGAIITGKKKR